MSAATTSEATSAGFSSQRPERRRRRASTWACQGCRKVGGGWAARSRRRAELRRPQRVEPRADRRANHGRAVPREARRGARDVPPGSQRSSTSARRATPRDATRALIDLMRTFILEGSAPPRAGSRHHRGGHRGHRAGQRPHRVGHALVAKVAAPIREDVFIASVPSRVVKCKCRERHQSRARAGDPHPGLSRPTPVPRSLRATNPFPLNASAEIASEVRDEPTRAPA